MEGKASTARSVRVNQRVNLTGEQALGKRDELVESGYTVVPGVIEPAFVAELRAWSEQVLRQRPVDPRYRYQGSDIAVLTPGYWAKLAGADRIETAKRFSHPLVERILDYPPLLEACRRLGLENLRSSESVVLLSKPPGGPPLYWHQDCVFWNSPRAATPWPTRISLSFPEPPTWWTGPVPEVVRTAAPAAAFEWTRTPSRYLGMD